MILINKSLTRLCSGLNGNVSNELRPLNHTIFKIIKAQWS